MMTTLASGGTQSAVALLPTLGWTWGGVLLNAVIVLFLFSSVLLILVVLVQRPQGGGLAGAFGSGAGSGQTAFGARTGDVLTYATIGFFTVFLLLAIFSGLAATAIAVQRPPAPATVAAPTGTTGTTGTGTQPPAGDTPQPANVNPPAPPAPAPPIPPADPNPVIPPADAPPTGG
ncbi:MAG: preprotein translocase subunit SecG [Isosphaera sp.]|nr:preprotein translocase subunit SecG [Isosphaera sp.]